MVAHVHQDFLPDPDAVQCTGASPPPDLPEISKLRWFHEPPDLFDPPGRCFRRATLSWFDENLDAIDDWNRFCESMANIDCLVLLDDRICINPNMKAFAKERTAKYAAMLGKCGIPFLVVGLEQN